MWLYNQASSAARTALTYITAGAMMVIWTLVWYLYLHNNPPDTNSVYYWCGGLLMTGLALMVIGFGLGRIGRAARHAEMPAEVVSPLAIIPPESATPTPVVALASPIAPAVPLDGRILATSLQAVRPLPAGDGLLSTNHKRVAQPVDQRLP
jgi:hypothetical protein